MAPAINATTGTLTYTPATSAVGRATMGVTLNDTTNSLSSDEQDFTIIIGPAVTDSFKVAEKETALSFSADDFTSNFSDGVALDTLEDVKIVSLPTSGELALSSSAVTVNQVITSVAIFENLSYEGDSGFVGLDGFQWVGSRTGRSIHLIPRQ